MNTTLFKITEEHTFTFKDKKSLCLMLIQEGDVFATEIVSRSDSFGRILFSTKKEAREHFDGLVEGLSKFDSYIVACKLLRTSQFKNTDKIKLFIKAHNKKLGQVQIGGIIQDFGLKVKSLVKKDKSMTIKIFFPGEKTEFGSFNGTFTKKNFVFCPNF